MRVRVWVALSISLAILALLPFVLPNYRVAFLQATFMNVALASSWNIIAGYTGYVSFGHAAFFGVGAYTASLLILRLGTHWLLAALVENPPLEPVGPRHQIACWVDVTTGKPRHGE